MFTGIVQGTAKIAKIADRDGLRTFTLEFPLVSVPTWP